MLILAYNVSITEVKQPEAVPAPCTYVYCTLLANPSSTSTAGTVTVRPAQPIAQGRRVGTPNNPEPLQLSLYLRKNVQSQAPNARGSPVLVAAMMAQLVSGLNMILRA
jgi:hypothetical protein